MSVIQLSRRPAHEPWGHKNGPGALVISLDFELRWGTRDSHSPVSASTLLKAREVVLQLLDLFETKRIAATWASVGMLFAESRDELCHYLPEILPTYEREKLNPYREVVGSDERNDPLHFAASLIRAIDSCPYQEIGSHTFSHYYCLEPGQTRPQFEADLASARHIADARNIKLRSLVFPRNQVNREFIPILKEQGIQCFRGTSRGWVHSASAFGNQRQWHKRAIRLADSYVPLLGTDVVDWPHEAFSEVSELTASRYFRPYSGGPSQVTARAVERIGRGLKLAAEAGKVYHLWFHPEDFGTYPEENLELLGQVLDQFEQLRGRYGMRSLSMSDACGLARHAETFAAA
ncbi:MAG: polysaccharide deacetylase family protein [Bryobacteraceae bacterium]